MRRRPASRARVPAAALLLLAVVGCDRGVSGVPTPAAAASTPDTPEQLEQRLVSTVPSGLPRLPDDGLEPPAGEKTVADVAGYAADPERERRVLEDYGYRFGWERFWGVGGGPLTGVSVHQMRNRVGADAYARDLAANEAAHYAGLLSENPPGLPGGCWLLTVDEATPGTDLTGPAALAFCGHGAFTVAVTAVAASVDTAEEEVRRLLPRQLDRLPPA